MKIFHGLDSFEPIKNPVVTIGTFDGVHQGHIKILKRIKTIADENNGETLLITFWPHPRMVISPNDFSLQLLNTFDEKANLLKENGIDNLLRIPFTKEFSQLTAHDFVKNILVDTIKTDWLVIGYDHHFGKGREGNFDKLVEWSSTYHYKVEEISRKDIEKVGISSTKIRESLLIGDVATAHKYLGMPYNMSGRIGSGMKLGRQLGFPTANLIIDSPYKLTPADGAYAVRVKLEGKLYNGMLNIGMRPTVDGTKRTIEVHLFDFDQQVYGETITVYFYHILRKEIKFPDIEALKLQLAQDKIKAQELLSNF